MKTLQPVYIDNFIITSKLNAKPKINKFNKFYIKTKYSEEPKNTINLKGNAKPSAKLIMNADS